MKSIELKTGTKKEFNPKTGQQLAYVQAIQSRDLVFGIGPAGTGKTYLAVAMAVSALLTKQMNRIILARPAVEAHQALEPQPGVYDDAYLAQIAATVSVLARHGVASLLDFRGKVVLVTGAGAELSRPPGRPCGL